jgi:phospholipase D
VIDQTTVVTGSFNFSTNAKCCNAENLLVIHRPALALAYAENFARQRAVSIEYVKAPSIVRWLSLYDHP